MAVRVVLLVPLGSLLIGCVDPVPPSAPAAGPPVTTSPAARPEASALPPPSPHPKARARLDAWESGLPAGWEIGRREDVGPYALVVAHREDSSREERGAVATESGMVETAWSKVVSHDRDVDGDGSADLVLLRDVVPDVEDFLKRAEPVVIADRGGAPALLPIHGLLPGHWASIGWAEGEKAALEFRTSGLEVGSQTLAWDGKALTATGTVVTVNCKSQRDMDGAVCEIVAGASVGPPVTRTLTSVRVDGVYGDALQDLAGDGARFYLLGVTDITDPSIPTRSIFGLVLEKTGWVETTVPDFDLATKKDRDGDGVPEIEQELGGIELTECKKSEIDCSPVLAVARGLHVWDGKTFSSRAPRLRAAYDKWTSELESDLAPPATDNCAVEHVVFAVQAYLAARWAGGDQAAGLAAADRVMKGASIKGCAYPNARARSWGDIRKEIVARAKLFLPEGVNDAPPVKPTKK